MARLARNRDQNLTVCRPPTANWDAIPQLEFAQRSQRPAGPIPPVMFESVVFTLPPSPPITTVGTTSHRYSWLPPSILGVVDGMASRRNSQCSDSGSLCGDMRRMKPRCDWVPDEEASSCQMDGCRSQFTFFSRRHHCRLCCRVVCSSHSQGWLDLLPPLSDSTSANSSPGGSAIDISGLLPSRASSLSSNAGSNESSAQNGLPQDRLTRSRVCDDCYYTTPTYPSLNFTVGSMHHQSPSGSATISPRSSDNLGGYAIDESNSMTSLEIPKIHAKRQRRQLDDDLPPVGSPAFTWSSF